MAHVTKSHGAPDWNGLSEGPGSIPGPAGDCVQISGVHVLRLIIPAGKMDSTVSSIICDCWLILS